MMIVIIAGVLAWIFAFWSIRRLATIDKRHPPQTCNVCAGTGQMLSRPYNFINHTGEPGELSYYGTCTKCNGKGQV